MTDGPEGTGQPGASGHSDGHRGDDHAGSQGFVLRPAHDFEAEKKERLEAIKRARERDSAYMRELADRDCSSPRPDPEKTAAVDYAESAMSMIVDAGAGMSAEGRAKAAYDMVLMLAGDDNISTPAFSMYVSRLRLEAPEALAGYAQRLLTSGTFFLAAGANTGHDLLTRLAEVVRLHLAADLGLHRPADLLKLETAVESMVQSRLLAHRATLLYDGLAAMSGAEVVLRRQAAECQRVFVRLLDELETVAGRTGRAKVQAALSDKAAARPVITELGPSAREQHRGGRRKDAAAEKA